MKTILAIAAALLLARGISAAADPGGEEILRNAQAAMSTVRDYTVSLDVAVNMERMKVPHMRALMYFKQPDKIHFDAAGFAMLPREGMTFNAERLLQRYAVEQTAREEVNGTPCYRLQLLAKADREPIRRMTVFIDPAHWTPAKIVVLSPDGRGLIAEFQHANVDGVWLPSALTVTFSQKTPEDSSEDVPRGPGRGGVPRQGTVKVLYSGYRVNTGLADEIFTAEKNPK